MTEKQKSSVHSTQHLTDGAELVFECGEEDDLMKLVRLNLLLEAHKVKV